MNKLIVFLANLLTISFERCLRSRLTRDGSSHNLVRDGSSRSRLTRDGSSRSRLTRDRSSRSRLTRDGTSRSRLTREGSSRSRLTRDGITVVTVLRFCSNICCLRNGNTHKNGNIFFRAWQRSNLINKLLYYLLELPCR